MQCRVQGCDFVGPRTGAYEHSKWCDGPLLPEASVELDAILANHPRMLDTRQHVCQVDQRVSQCGSHVTVEIADVDSVAAQAYDDPGTLNLHDLSYQSSSV
jgi:hypothetical protein